MDKRIRELKGGNLDIDLVSQEKVDWKQYECPWNVTEKSDNHKCAIKKFLSVNTSVVLSIWTAFCAAIRMKILL
jgi:hypothetical protein